MFFYPENNSDNNKMATEKKRFIKYKAISDKLQEHFGFKLLADGNTKMLTKFIAFIATI